MIAVDHLLRLSLSFQTTNALNSIAYRGLIASVFNSPWRSATDEKLDLFFDNLTLAQQNKILEEYQSSTKFFGLSDEIEYGLFGLNSERSKKNFRYFLFSKKDTYQIF